MLAEKFILVLETLLRRNDVYASPRVISTSPHVPVVLPTAMQKS